MRAVLAVLALVAPITAYGCTTRDSGTEESDLVAGGRLAASVEVQVGASAVRLVMHVTNRTDAPVEFTFPSSQRYDFQILDASGESVWTWSADKAFMQMITEVALPAGETWTFEETWDPAGRTGRFEAVGTLTAQESVEQRMTFDLP